MGILRNSEINYVLMNDLIKSTQGLFSLLETLHPFCELQYLVKGKRNGKKQFSPSYPNTYMLWKLSKDFFKKDILGKTTWEKTKCLQRKICI
jgi:hypothetical protein